jgi:uncharacterized protein (DUF2147 family)
VVDANGVIFTEVLIMRHHAFAAAMGIATAALLAPSSQSLAASADPTGYWMKPDAERESKIQVFKCGTGKKSLCAKIAWLKEPNDSKGKPLHDIRNENPAMRGRSIVGLAIFTGLTPSAPSTWTGKIYNPEDGHTYSATLTVLSRKQILLRGCKAWLLCGEKQWLRTSAPPEEVTPTEQIEASAEPASPPSQPAVEPAAAVAAAAPAEAPSAAAVQPAAAIAAAAPAETPSAAPATQAEALALAGPQTSPAPQAVPAPQSEAVVTKASLVTQQVAAPVPPPAEVDARDGYGFLNVSAGPDTAARLSGENVSSMFAMTEPIPADAAPAASDQAITTAAVQSEQPVPAPAPKPKAKPTPVATAAAAKPAPKAATAVKPAGQAAPAPQEAEAAPAGADAAETPPAETAEAAMTEPVPLTRRQRRLLRKQQEQGQEPFLPWLR